jgi:adenine-specific DNA-methyltransferase
MVINKLNKSAIDNRRYIGSKAKLSDWIFGIIKDNINDAKSFCDIFAGTGVMSRKAAVLYDKVIVNDFLYSNVIIYKAFMGNGKWNETKLNDIITIFNSIDDEEIEDNWFSNYYGDKYFENNTAKKIGYIRQYIEDKRMELTEKEYDILLASLIYAIDKVANTVGHFDAYMKKVIVNKKMCIKLIDAHSFNNVEIYQEDANILARNVVSDITYVDPPYNSRQYSRFYHIYETLVKWNKPKLYGVALKPKPTNMSEYCRAGAYAAFNDLIINLHTKYIAVSYNNTYDSKSHSSKNKIKLGQIFNTLKEIGETKIFTHEYKAFNTGKTNFNEHKELLFLTKVK